MSAEHEPDCHINGCTTDCPPYVEPAPASGRVLTPLDAETQALLASSVRDCGHPECQEVLGELRTYGRRLTPQEREEMRREA